MVSWPGRERQSAGLRSRTHTAGAGLKPADSTRRVSVLLLSGAVSCCCPSRRCCSRSARAAENLAAHRCSHLLSRSRGIRLTTKAPGFAVTPRVIGLNACGPLKVQSEGIKLFWQVTRTQRWRPVRWARIGRHVRPQIPDSPAAFLESWEGGWGRNSRLTPRSPSLRVTFCLVTRIE
jgi:NAD(P)-dependent dehydrogenase (short-subunit alcohol dehydrogenase family)